MLTVVFLVLGGILASASLIVARKPNAQELIDKITPYQGWIGMALFFWGIWDVIQLIRVIGVLFKVSLFYGIFYVIAVPTELLLGFLLGFGLITKYALSKNETAMAKGAAIRKTLAPLQGILGILGIAVGLTLLVLRFLH